MSGREELMAAAREKPVAPYTLDPQLTFFCPQENLEGLELAVVREFLGWAATELEPPDPATPRVLLLLPCQRTKPYTLSEEHLAVNRRLLAEGFSPTGPGDPPAELASDLPAELLSNAPLELNGLRVDRVVISEPFAYVPYEAVYHWRGELSPCARYDDPGLFEHRGIEPVWRSDCTTRGGRWGDREREAYVEVHNRMAEQLHRVISRLRPNYEAVLGYVAPYLTHRTFLADEAERRSSGIPTAREVDGDERQLVGVNDLTPGLVELIPGGEQLAALGERLGKVDDSILLEPACLELLVDRLRIAGGLDRG